MLLPRSSSVVLSRFAIWWLMGFCIRMGKKKKVSIKNPINNSYYNDSEFKMFNCISQSEGNEISVK